MAAIRSFRELIAYQKARVAAKEVFHLTKRFPREERYSLTDQIRRSSRAVAAMIAEAWARRSYEAVFVNKLNEAQGEATESQGSGLTHKPRRGGSSRAARTPPAQSGRNESPGTTALGTPLRRSARHYWSQRDQFHLHESRHASALSQGWLDSALDCEYITTEEHARFDALFQEAGAILQGMIDRSDTFCPSPRR